MAEEKVYCRDCKHLHLPKVPNLFSSTSLGNPEVLKKKMEYENYLRQIEKEEYMSFKQKQPFTKEPMFYSWCEAWTKRLADEKEAIESSYGDVLTIYELADRHNNNHDCSLYEEDS
jgi:hypothetical protein